MVFIIIFFATMLNVVSSYTSQQQLVPNGENVTRENRWYHNDPYNERVLDQEKLKALPGELIYFGSLACELADQNTLELYLKDKSIYPNLGNIFVAMLANNQNVTVPRNHSDPYDACSYKNTLFFPVLDNIPPDSFTKYDEHGQHLLMKFVRCLGWNNPLLMRLLERAAEEPEIDLTMQTKAPDKLEGSMLAHCMAARLPMRWEEGTTYYAVDRTNTILSILARYHEVTSMQKGSNITGLDPFCITALDHYRNNNSVYDIIRKKGFGEMFAHQLRLQKAQQG